jgi:hypothetical protein
MTMAESIAYALRMHGLPGKERRSAPKGAGQSHPPYAKAQTKLAVAA